MRANFLTMLGLSFALTALFLVGCKPAKPAAKIDPHSPEAALAQILEQGRLLTAAVKRYLNEAETGYLMKLQALAETKNKLDIHYALQTVMKSWLLFHLPLTLAVLMFALWHVLLVHAYAL